MPAPILHVGATVLCSHAGQATPTGPFPRVSVSGQPVVTLASPWVIAGCPFNVSGTPTPCISGQVLVAATRVTAGGQPLVTMAMSSVCVPNGTPLMPVSAQLRVLAT